MSYPANTPEAGPGTILSDAAEYVRDQWDAFVHLSPRIIDLQHRAALAAQAARASGDATSEEAAKAMIRTLGELNVAHGRVLDHFQPYLQYVGLGAVAVPVVVATAFSALALVVAWYFRKVALQEELLEQLEAGNLTERGYLAAQEELGAMPGPVQAGTDLAKLALWAFLAWLAFQAFGVWRGLKPNPPLTIFKSNPPGVMSDRAWFLAYRHADDGEDYIHDFGPDVHLEAQEDGSVCLWHPTRPVWREFPE